MRSIFIGVFILFHFAGYTQGSEITYILPDSVEVRIYNHMLKRQNANKDSKHYFFLKRDTEEAYSLTIIPFKKSDQTKDINWVNSSNRYILIEKQLYPLLLDYDFIFSTPDLNVGDFRSRDGNIRKLHLLAHGYTIFFKTNGTVLKEEHW